MQEIKVTFGEQGLQVEANTPPVVTLGLLELAKSMLIKQVTEPADQPKIIPATPAALSLVK